MRKTQITQDIAKHNYRFGDVANAFVSSCDDKCWKPILWYPFTWQVIFRQVFFPTVALLTAKGIPAFNLRISYNIHVCQIKCANQRFVNVYNTCNTLSIPRKHINYMIEIIIIHHTYMNIFIHIYVWWMIHCINCRPIWNIRSKWYWFVDPLDTITQTYI